METYLIRKWTYMAGMIACVFLDTNGKHLIAMGVFSRNDPMHENQIFNNNSFNNFFNYIVNETVSLGDTAISLHTPAPT